MSKAFKVGRIDYHWERTEKEKAVYDFTTYDALTERMLAHNIIPLYILDYGNPIYNFTNSISIPN